MKDYEGDIMNWFVRVFRRLVFIALLPAILVAGLILLPVFVIARLVGLGPRGRGCGRGRRSEPPADEAVV
jgi:hypothetical protein